MIRPIETRYKGYRFRSRLEARWAVFFDNVGFNWKYENEGYESDRGRYLPDFDLGNGTFAEVKGDKFALSREYEKHEMLHDFGGVLPGFCESVGSANGLILLGEIPAGEEGVSYFHPIIQHDSGLHRSWIMFGHGKNWFEDGNRLIQVGDGTLSMLCELDSDIICGKKDGWIVETKEFRFKRYYPKVCEAYKAARAARFEHGEQG